MISDPVWTVQLVVAGVFLITGFSKVRAYRRQTAGLENEPDCKCLGLPYPCAVLIGLLEILGALALVVPIHLWGPDVPARLAAGLLALLTAAACIYHVRRKVSADPLIALFLTVLLVIVGRWM